MTIQDYGSIGEIIGAVATVATLAYLAYQIRQNTQTARLSATAAYSSSVNSITHLLAQDDSARRVYFGGLRDYASLSQDDQERFETLLMLYVSGIQQTFFMKEHGLPEDAWRQVENSFLWVVQQPGFSLFWENWSESNSPRFVAWVEENAAPLRRPRSAAAQQRAAADSAGGE